MTMHRVIILTNGVKLGNAMTNFANKLKENIQNKVKSPDFIFQIIPSNNNEFIKRYNITRFPTTLVMKGNTLIKMFTGNYTDGSIEEYIKRLKNL